MSHRADEDLRRTQIQFEVAQQLAQVGSWEWDADTNTVTWSAELYRIFGLQPEEFRATYEGFLERVHPDDRERVARIVEQAFRDGQPFTYVHRIVRPDGTVRTLLSHGRVVTDENGRVVRMFGTGQDITERKQAEEALRKSESKFRAVAESLGAALFVFRGQRYLYVNAESERLTGYSRDELLAMDVWDTAHPDVRAQIRERVLARQRGEPEPTRYETKLLTKDGEERWIVLNLAPIEYEGQPAFIGTGFDITERKRTEAALRSSEANYRGLFENLLEGVYQSTRDGRFLSVNPAFVRMLGYDSEADVLRMDIARDLYASPADREAFIRDVEATGALRPREVTIKRRDGQIIHVLRSARAVRDEQGELLYYEGMVIDISELKQLEEELRQAQKMEAVGRLAGGIAHAFNNLLMVMVGQSELLLKSLPPESAARQDVEEIKTAGRRAAALTRQLLAFGRKQVLQPTVVDLNAVVGRMESMLRQLIGEHLDVRIELDPRLSPVRVDVGQIEQVVLNLVLNARDAMPGGGRITVRTRNITDSAFRDLPPTSGMPRLPTRVLLEVSDSGVGIDDETRSRLFEPFFTTKERGKGAGLGLATVYGIVRQSGGTIEIATAPGEGSTFSVYLPAVEAAPSVEAVAALGNEDERGNEIVLLVEDEAPVRSVVRSMLQEYGYKVLEADTPADAERLARTEAGPIHLLLTDVVMPQMNGAVLAARLQAMRPGLKVVYMSGYAQPALEPDGPLNRGSAYLQKPFGPDVLVKKLRQTLTSTP